MSVYTGMEQTGASGKLSRVKATVMARRRVVSLVLPDLVHDGRGPREAEAEGPSAGKLTS